MKNVIATWIDTQYVVTDTGSADEWYSVDGEDWVTQDGREVDTSDCKITLRYGPRDGQTA